MSSIYDLLDRGENTLAEALVAGLIPFSLISIAIDYAERNDLKSLDLFELREDYITGAFLPKLDKTIEITAKEVLVSVFDSLCLQYADTKLSLKNLKNSGLQVDVELYKKSGKYAYGGLVSLGAEARPWSDNLTDLLSEKQKIISGNNLSDYTVVVRDTTINNSDRNYSFCMSQVL